MQLIFHFLAIVLCVWISGTIKPVGGQNSNPPSDKTEEDDKTKEDGKENEDDENDDDENESSVSVDTTVLQENCVEAPKDFLTEIPELRSATEGLLHRFQVTDAADFIVGISKSEYSAEALRSFLSSHWYWITPTILGVVSLVVYVIMLGISPFVSYGKSEKRPYESNIIFTVLWIIGSIVLIGGMLACCFLIQFNASNLTKTVILTKCEVYMFLRGTILGTDASYTHVPTTDDISWAGLSYFVQPFEATAYRLRDQSHGMYSWRSSESLTNARITEVGLDLDSMNAEFVVFEAFVSGNSHTCLVCDVEISSNAVVKNVKTSRDTVVTLLDDNIGPTSPIVATLAGLMDTVGDAMKRLIQQVNTILDKWATMDGDTKSTSYMFLHLGIGLNVTIFICLVIYCIGLFFQTKDFFFKSTGRHRIPCYICSCASFGCCGPLFLMLGGGLSVLLYLTLGICEVKDMIIVDKDYDVLNGGKFEIQEVYQPWIEECLNLDGSGNFMKAIGFEDAITDFRQIIDDVETSFDSDAALKSSLPGTSDKMYDLAMYSWIVLPNVQMWTTRANTLSATLHADFFKFGNQLPNVEVPCSLIEGLGLPNTDCNANPNLTIMGIVALNDLINQIVETNAAKSTTQSWQKNWCMNSLKDLDISWCKTSPNLILATTDTTTDATISTEFDNIVAANSADEVIAKQWRMLVELAQKKEKIMAEISTTSFADGDDYLEYAPYIVDANVTESTLARRINERIVENFREIEQYFTKIVGESSTNVRAAIGTIDESNDVADCRYVGSALHKTTENICKGISANLLNVAAGAIMFYFFGILGVILMYAAFWRQKKFQGTVDQTPGSFSF